MQRSQVQRLAPGIVVKIAGNRDQESNIVSARRNQSGDAAASRITDENQTLGLKTHFQLIDGLVGSGNDQRRKSLPTPKG